MAVTNKIFIPTFISSINYEPVRTLPHLYFYNGLKESEEYFIQHYPSGSTSSIVNSSQTSFPYLDYYDGLTPNSSSNSLLFFNELPAYGEAPTGSLYTEYWDTYVSLLYNPRTRLFNASAIIPLADYFEMELNDIVQWRGNYYHLRAINDYNLKDGTCKIELLGPIIRDAVSEEVPPTPPISNCIFNFSSSVEPVVTTTTTAAPTTTTTTTTTAAPVENCTAYVVGTRTGAAFFFTYRECGTGILRTISINQNNRVWYFCGAVTSGIPPWGYVNEIGPCSEPIPPSTTTTTTTAGPTTTTTTTLAPCVDCILYEIDDASSPTTYNATYTDCNGLTNRNISGTQGATRFFTALSGSLVYSGTRAIFNRGPVGAEYAGSVCKTLDYCKYQTITLQDKGGSQFVYIDFIDTASCAPGGIIQGPTQGGQITIISGSLATDPSIVASFGSVQTGGICCSTTTTTTTMAP
jgi:hypothetical protein